MPQYVIIHDGQIKFGPKDWDRQYLQANLAELGITNLSLPADPREIRMGNLAITAIYDPGCAYDPQTQTATRSVNVGEGGAPAVQWTVADRDLAEVKAELIRQLKSATQAAILAACPIHRQLNAANGILPAEETAIVTSTVASHRDACNAKETAINAATTPQGAVEAVV